MKRFLCLLMALSLLLCGCISDPLQNDPAQTSHPGWTTPPEDLFTTQPTESAAYVANVVFDHWYSGDQEQGSLTAYAEDGSVVWSYTAGSYDIAQLDFISDIGSHGSRYYISEKGCILAFDWETGELLWKNDDFRGSPLGADCSAFDENGTLYICGYFGPDLFVVDAAGNTVYSDDSLHPDLFWSSSMKLTDQWLSITLDAGAYGDMGTAYLAYVHKNLPPAPVTAAEAADLVCDLYKTLTEADGSYVVFDSECFKDSGYYTMTVRYQLSDAEAERILANGGAPAANTYVATVKVDAETGYIFPEAY